MKHIQTITLLALFAGASLTASAKWQPAGAPLATRWTQEVSPKNALPEYPRPQMVRSKWLNLNGPWDFALTAKDAPQPQSYDTQILVPFPVESALSGVKKTVTEKDRLWYRRTFEVPRSWRGQRVLLHFGAVDFEAKVWVNGKELGQHRGGYDAFDFDIADALKPSGPNELIVSAWDPTDGGPYARGKQVRKPDQGIFYTACSGIWQTVWLEPVAPTHIESLKVTPDLDASAMTIQATVRSATGGDVAVKVEVLDGNKVVQGARIGTSSTVGESVAPRIILKVPDAKPWSPDSPFLYGLRVTLLGNGKTVDEVKSYFGMRKISLGQDQGVTKIFLNNKPLFQLGPLDQGFWPDGIYTAPTDAALRYDIEMTRKMGFNMARKHVKVESERWYYWADKLGLLVWQDMPSANNNTDEGKQQFEVELRRLVEGRGNHPSVVMWVVFNEGWGQHDTERLTGWVKSLDPSRLVNNASGWTDRKAGDVMDMHNYPGPGSPKPEPSRAAVLGEFGGLGFKVDGHTWAGRTWGYRGMASVDVLARQYHKLLRGVAALRESPGLSAAVYTQTTDVEYEGNGLMTYDRALVKMGLERVAAANRGDFLPEPKITEIIPTSRKEGVPWRYTLEKPADDWFQPGFAADGWKEAPGGFGTRGTPGAVVRTEWRTGDIWLRREFIFPEGQPGELRLLMHHDEDAEVYLNGVLAAKASGFIGDYEDFDLSPEARKALKPGKSLMAVHCHQTTGGQYIDVGIVAVEKPVR